MVSLLIKTLISSAKGPGLMTSFNPNYFPKGPISKYHHKGWGYSVSMNLGVWEDKAFSQ